VSFVTTASSRTPGGGTCLGGSFLKPIVLARSGKTKRQKVKFGCDKCLKKKQVVHSLSKDQLNVDLSGTVFSSGSGKIPEMAKASN
jgi:hypothetical protein